jgi:uncharacterized SAM-binding protein YcdF (DUF218 family)
MVLLFTDVFLLLTQVLLWLIVGIFVWFVLLRALPQKFLGLLVLLLILLVLAYTYVGGPPSDRGVVEALWRIISWPFTLPGALLTMILLLNQKKQPDWLSKSKPIKTGIKVFIGLVIVASIPLISTLIVQNWEADALAMVKPAPALTGARRVIVLMGQGTTRPQVRPPVETRPTDEKGGGPKITEEAFQVLSQLPIQLTDQGDRIIYAANLYNEQLRQGNAPLLVVTGNRRPDRRRKDGENPEDVSEARFVRDFLTQSLGINASDIVLENKGIDVHDSAEQVRDLLKNQQINFGNQLMVVTSAVSMNRTALTFAKVFDGSTIISRPTNFQALPPVNSLSRLVKGRDLVERDLQIPNDLLPNLQSLRVSSQVWDEFLASTFYFLRGWISPFQRN